MAAFLDYAESLAESTSTSSTFASKVAVTPTLVSGTTYLIIWSCQIQNSSTSGDTNLRLRDHTGSASLQLYNLTAPKDGTDYLLASGTHLYTAGASAAREFRIEYNEDAASGTAAIKNARILILALDGSDFSTSSTGSSSTTSTSFQDKATLSVNGATAGDYLFVASIVNTQGSGIAEFQGLKTDGTTAVNTTAALYHGASAGGQPWAAIWRETLTGANVSAKIQWRSTSGASATVQDAHLTAIRLDSLGDSNAYTLDDVDDGGTSSVIGDSETLSGSGVDTVGGDVLVIAAVTYKGDSTTVSSFVDFQEGSTTIVESFHEHRSATVENLSGIIGYLSSSANDPETWRWRRRSESGSSTTTTVRYAAIAVLGLSGADSIVGEASITEAGDTVSSAGKLYIAGTASKTEANDSVSGAGKLYIAGALSRTEADDSISAAGKFFTNGAASITEAGDSLSAAGELDIKGVVSVTEASDSLSATGTLLIAGTLSATEASDSLSSTGELDIRGVVSQTEASDSLVGEGILPIVGALAVTEASDSVEASDYVPRGRLEQTLEGDFLRAEGETPTEWFDAQATSGDKPNWNQCGRCNRKVRPNKLIRQMEYAGPRLIWTGLRVCSSCLDEPHPTNRWAGYVEMAGDPRPVPNPRPRKD